jgi:hypothetical protein
MVENFDGLKIIRRPSSYSEELADLTTIISKKQNEKMSVLLPGGKLENFDVEGRVNINSFSKEFGGLEIKADLKKVDEIEENFFLKENSETIQAYSARKGFTVEEAKQEVKNESALRDGNIAEVAINALFHKALANKNLVVARTTRLDDLNGIDTFIFDPETGEIICGFDEVNYRDEEQENINSPDRKAKKEGIDKKKEKVLNTVKDGGAKLKYAYRLKKDENGQKIVKQGSVENLPVLYLGISKSDLVKLLAEMDFDNSEGMNDFERKIFNQICSSIDEQLEMFNKEKNIPKAVRENLNKLPDFLKKLKE